MEKKEYKKKFSIIVPVRAVQEPDGRYNEKYFSLCMDSLVRFTDLKDCEVIIVDDNDNPTPGKFFGYNQKLDVGVKQSCGEWLIFAQTDLVFNQGWLSNFELAIHQPPPKDIKLGLIGWCGMFMTGEQSAFKGKLGGIMPCKKIVMALSAMHRSVYDDVGIDIDFPCNNYTDDDLSFRCLEKGYTNIIIPHYIFHFAFGSSRGPIEYEKDLLMGKEYMDKKHGKMWKMVLY